MHRSTPGNPGGVGALCRLAEELFAALREEFDIDAVMSVPPSDVVDDAHLDQRDLVMICMRCAQLIHSLGRAPECIDQHETIAVIFVLDVTLRRLLRGRQNGSRAVAQLHRIHREFVERGYRETAAAALGGEAPDRR
jgi:hypothetical protein